MHKAQIIVAAYFSPGHVERIEKPERLIEVLQGFVMLLKSLVHHSDPIDGKSLASVVL